MDSYLGLIRLDNKVYSLSKYDTPRDPGWVGLVGGRLEALWSDS